MEILFTFLKWVSSFHTVDEESGSKMDIHNLATVIAPNILCSSAKSPELENTFLAVEAVHCLIECIETMCEVCDVVTVITPAGTDIYIFRSPKISSQFSMTRLSPRTVRTSQQKKFSNATAISAPLPFLNPHHQQHRLHLHGLNDTTGALVWLTLTQMRGKTKHPSDTWAEVELVTAVPITEWLHHQ
jgi:hypothetical protein